LERGRLGEGPWFYPFTEDPKRRSGGRNVAKNRGKQKKSGKVKKKLDIPEGNYKGYDSCRTQLWGALSMGQGGSNKREEQN